MCYRDPHVRARIVEYLGGRNLSEATCAYIAGSSEPASSEFQPRPPHDLDLLLEQGAEIFRSLWDRESLIVHLDLEYVNFDFPAEAYLDPWRAFELQQPVERFAEEIFAASGIRPLHIISGRGHHFVWKISKGSAAYGRLQDIGPLPHHLEEYYAQSLSPSGKSIEPGLGRAYAGLGLLIEYLSIRLKETASPQSEVPVEVSAVAVPPQQRGKEMISIDITEYGDPLNTRSIAVPFGAYLKPWRKAGILHDGITSHVSPMFPVPLHEMTAAEALRVMREPAEVTRLAAVTTASIPGQDQGAESLIQEYSKSDVAKYHDWFYSQEHEPASAWPATYDRTSLDPLPPCTARILEHPNDRLLKPAGIREVVRVMLALGWHPRHIAGLIRSKFERDHGWGSEWYVYDAATRADFYVRLFAGLIYFGLDDLGHFDCGFAEGMESCSRPEGACSLAELRHSLLQRRKHGRLACRPFHRLFLPDQHI